MFSSVSINPGIIRMAPTSSWQPDSQVHAPAKTPDDDFYRAAPHAALPLSRPSSRCGILKGRKLQHGRKLPVHPMDPCHIPAQDTREKQYMAFPDQVCPCFRFSVGRGKQIFEGKDHVRVLLYDSQHTGTAVLV